jgi:hypothetical protein
MARTAVVAGTATAVSNRVSRRQANRWSAQQEPQYDNSYGAPQAAYAAAPADAAPDPYEQLAKLAQLKDRGVLSTAEFEVEKAKILRG